MTSQKREENEPREGLAPRAIGDRLKLAAAAIQQPENVQLPAILDRRLRNRLLLANLLIWIVILVAIYWWFFDDSSITLTDPRCSWMSEGEKHDRHGGNVLGLRDRLSAGRLEPAHLS